MYLHFLLQGGAGGGGFGLLFPVLLIAVFYLFFIRPQMKKQKEQTAFQSELQKGDEVVTNSGIIGRINRMDPQSITLEIENKTFIRVLPTAISKEMTDMYRKAGSGSSN